VSTIVERTLILFKPGGMDRFSDVRIMIVRTVDVNGFHIVHEDHIDLSDKQGKELYRMHKGQWYHCLLAEQVSSCQLYGMVIEGEDAVSVIKRLAGPTKPEEAKTEAPGSIRGQFVIDNYAERKAKCEVVDNICHASGTPDEAKWEIGVVFPRLQSYDHAQCGI